MRRWVARVALKAVGWTPKGSLPESKKFVIVAAPHTSNWDLPLLVFMAWQFGLHVHWLGKHTLFPWPIGWFMRLMGGISVDRRARHNVVQQVVDVFDKAETLVLAVPPEGTRGRAEYWKSGFYHIAAGARIPLVLGFLDYGKKEGGFGPSLIPGGDQEADLQVMRDFYRDIKGKHPECFGPIEFRPQVVETP